MAILIGVHDLSIINGFRGCSSLRGMLYCYRVKFGLSHFLNHEAHPMGYIINRCVKTVEICLGFAWVTRFSSLDEQKSITNLGVHGGEHLLPPSFGRNENYKCIQICHVWCHTMCTDVRNHMTVIIIVDRE